MTDLNDVIPQHHRKRFFETRKTLFSVKKETIDQFLTRPGYKPEICGL